MMKNSLKLLILLVLISVSLMAISAINQDDPAQKIIGTWIAEGSTFNQRDVYKSNGIYESYFENKIDKTYRYSLSKEKSVDGTLTFDVLTLTNINDSDDVYIYVIDALTDKVMRLEWEERPGKYLLYHKYK